MGTLSALVSHRGAVGARHDGPDTHDDALTVLANHDLVAPVYP